MKYTELIDFVTNDLNDRNQHANAVAYDGESFEKFMNVLVVFNRNHTKLYSRLLVFCAEHGGIIIETHPGTYGTVVRVETENR